MMKITGFMTSLAQCANIWIVTSLLVLLGAQGHAQTYQPAYDFNDNCEFIRQALKALPAKGGEVVVPTGTYNCTGPIILDRDHLALRGEPGALLRLMDHSNAPVIIMGDINTPPKPLTDVRVSFLSIDGNRLGQEIECWGGSCDAGGTAFIRNNGITVRGITNGLIQNVSIRGARSGGVVTEKGCYNLHIDHLTSTDNFFDGFAGYETYGALLTNLDLSHNRSAGISIDLRFNGNTIRDTVISHNGDVGIFMRDSNQNHFENLKIEDSANHGIFLSEADDITSCANDNEFLNLSVARSQGMGFVLNSACKGNSLTGAASFKQNRDGCIYEGTSVRLERRGSIVCDN